MAAGRPYYRLGLAVVLGPGAGDRTSRSLADLKGLRVGAPGETHDVVGKDAAWHMMLPVVSLLD